MPAKTWVIVLTACHFTVIDRYLPLRNVRIGLAASSNLAGRLNAGRPVANSQQQTQPTAESLADALRRLQEMVAPPGSLADTVRRLQQVSFNTQFQLDTKGVEFGPWIRRFIGEIGQHRFVRYATMASRGSVVMTCNIHKDGSVRDAAVTRSSSIDEFDTAMLAALTATKSPLPPEFPDETAHLTLTVFLNEQPDATSPLPPPVGWPPSGVFIAGTEGVTLPKVVREEPVHYTSEAMRERLEGSVVLEGIVQPGGSFMYGHVIHSLDSTIGLDREALRAAAQYRFTPGLRMGQPVPVVMTLEIAFSLKK
jgi:TonB family protein